VARGGALAVAAIVVTACGSGAARPAAVEPAAQASTTPAPMPSPAPSSPMPQAAATPTPSPTPEAATSPSPTPPYRNTVRWATASELDNFGYDVYRGTSADGPFERITPDPVPGAGTTDETHRYSFADDDIDPHQTYYYYVESISITGHRERFTPVIEAKPKLPPPSP